MPIFYHPSQVDAEEERAQQSQSAIPSTAFARLGDQFVKNVLPNRLDAPINASSVPPEVAKLIASIPGADQQTLNNVPIGSHGAIKNPDGSISTPDQTGATSDNQSSGTQQPSSDLQSLIDRIKQVQMDPKYTAELDKFAPSQAPALPATPVGFKQRFLFGLGQGLQAMANRAANQPQISPLPQDDVLGSIAAGLSGGVLSGLNPGRAIQKSYLDNTLPLYYRNEMAKSQQRKAILEEAKAAGATAPERLKQLMDQLKAYGDAETTRGKRITNNALPTKLAQEEKQRGINIDTSGYKRDIAPIVEADRRRAAASAEELKQLNIRLQHGTIDSKVAKIKADAQRASVLAGKQEALSNSQIERNNAAADKSRNSKSNISTTQQAKAAAQQSWDTKVEPKMFEEWKKQRLVDNTAGGLMDQINKLPNDGNKDARAKELIQKAWERYKANNPNYKKAYDQHMKEESARALSELGGDNSGNTYAPPSRVQGNVEKIKGFSWK